MYALVHGSLGLQMHTAKLCSAGKVRSAYKFAWSKLMNSVSSWNYL